MWVLLLVLLELQMWVLVCLGMVVGRGVICSVVMLLKGMDRSVDRRTVMIVMLMLMLMLMLSMMVVLMLMMMMMIVIVIMMMIRLMRNRIEVYR